MVGVKLSHGAKEVFLYCDSWPQSNRQCWLVEAEAPGDGRGSLIPLCVNPVWLYKLKKKEMGGGLQNHKLVLEQPEHP